MQINLELRIPTRTTLLVSDSLRVLKEYSWLCPWLFPWPDYEEDYQDDGQQDVYDNWDHLPSSALPVTLKMELLKGICLRGNNKVVIIIFRCIDCTKIGS